MEHTTRIPPAEITGIRGALIKWMTTRKLGKVPTAVIAFANMTTRGNVALGIESDGFAAACGLQPLATRPAVASRS